MSDVRHTVPGMTEPTPPLRRQGERSLDVVTGHGRNRGAEQGGQKDEPFRTPIERNAAPLPNKH